MDKKELLARLRRLEEEARRVYADIGSIRSDIEQFFKENGTEKTS